MILPALALAIVGAAQSVATIDETIIKVACQGHGKCRIVETYEAGTGAEGEALEVVEFAIEDSSDAMCQPYRRDFLLVARKSLSALVEVTAQKFLSLCNDGNGAAGQDTIEVSENLLQHRQEGGLSSRWLTTDTYQLSPLHLMEQTKCSFGLLSPGFDVREWKLKDFILKGHRKRYACSAEGAVDVDEDAPFGCILETPHLEFIAVPRIFMSLPTLKTTELALADCAASVDSSGEKGWIVHGSPGAPGDAELRALFTDDTTLLVSALDDKYVEEGRTWVETDHFEIWVGRDGGGINCEDAGIVPTQWAVLPSGAVINTHGPSDTAPRVEVQRGWRGPSKTLEMLAIVRFAEKPERLTIVYSDSDDGRTQERLIATSPLEFGKNETLGEAVDVPQSAARCMIKDGAIARSSWGEVQILPEADQ